LKWDAKILIFRLHNNDTLGLDSLEDFDGVVALIVAYVFKKYEAMIN